MLPFGPAVVTAPSTVPLESMQSPPQSSTRTRLLHESPRSVLWEKKMRELSLGKRLPYLSSSFHDVKSVPLDTVCERSSPSHALSCIVGGYSPICSPESKVIPASVERWTTMRQRNSESDQLVPERCS